MRPRLLLVAYCCSPDDGSEPAVGWNMARLAAEQFDVTVVVEEHKFSESINRWLETNGPIDNVTFVFVPEKWWAHGMWSAGLGYVSYRWWHRRALAKATELHRQQPFDAVHLATIIGFREPGYWTELGVPFIWGPIGGTHNFPTEFLGETSFVRACLERFRSGLNTFQLRCSRRVQHALNNAAAVVASNREIGRDLQQVVERPIDTINEITLPNREPHRVFRSDVSDELRVLWSGRCEARKCLSLLIRAVARVQSDIPIRVRVVGDGYERQRWESLASRLGVADRFEWLGWVAYEESLEQFEWADVFAFTSVRDTTGTVLLEALDAGLPVIGPDHQGAQYVVTEDCGIRVSMERIDTAVAGIASALTKLTVDNVLRSQLANGAQQRANDFRFNAKLSQWTAVWSRVVGANTLENDVDESNFDEECDASVGETVCVGEGPS